MTITDLTSMTMPEKDKKERIKKILESLQQDIPEFCFQCGKCTSGCEAMKLLELEPHKIMSMTKLGFIEELINSDIIWTCITCYKCKERCPQRVAPVEVLYSIKNLAIAAGKQPAAQHRQGLIQRDGARVAAEVVPSRAASLAGDQAPRAQGGHNLADIGNGQSLRGRNLADGDRPLATVSSGQLHKAA